MNDPIPPALAGFLTSHLSMHVAAGCGDGLATLVRAVGARIAPEAPHCLRLLVPRAQAVDLIEAISAGAPVAAVFNEPETHRTVQLKCARAEVVAAEAADVATLAPYVRAMAARLRAFGTPEPYAHTVLACAPDEVVVIRLAPEAVFGQSPGPRAGERMAPGAPLP
ncbi:hypothetical protein G3580_01905 [Nitrogeniibacter mangrovi]|uniref:Pyridoxamine 5'-phosphate oxidase putative domain-containing protein n=1 Tax=Nitrogeniibacter mangrovi TaxID=2016596 RepID=A0A6C1AYQ5_9RHOO|nr:hypothetical protein [Nitrogeniibacter mangrovi]QID16486.1 hypothetical protein G3580_01905 [Nitrogeniibacter mangrovi]